MDRDDFEYDEYDNYEEPEEIEKPLINDLELLRLSHCAESSKKGIADQGFPKTMKRLGALKFVVQVDKGYKVTNEGLLYLQKYKDKLKTI